jgi:hypothetical protein
MKDNDEIYHNQKELNKILYKKEDIEKNIKFNDPEYKLRYENFNNRINSFCEQKYKTPMIPGYTGTIIRAKNV